MAEVTSTSSRPASSQQDDDRHRNCVRAPIPRRSTVERLIASAEAFLYAASAVILLRRGALLMRFEMGSKRDQTPHVSYV